MAVFVFFPDESYPEPVLAAPGGGGYLLYSSWDQEGVTKLFPGELFKLFLSCVRFLLQVSKIATGFYELVT